MHTFKLLAASALVAAGFLLPLASAQAASLTQDQIASVISLLTAFGVDSTTIGNVRATLSGTGVTVSTTTASTSVAPGAINAALIGYLRLGDRGDAVKYLQTILAADPSVYSGDITGYFGPLTEAALKAYQKKHGLDQVGSVGPKTLKDLDQDLDENPLGAATSTGGMPCIIPPGHLIAPGWLKHHDGGQMQVIPSCEKLPPGISAKLGGSVASSTATSTATSTGS